MDEIRGSVDSEFRREQPAARGVACNRCCNAGNNTNSVKLFCMRTAVHATSPSSSVDVESSTTTTCTSVATLYTMSLASTKADEGKLQGTKCVPLFHLPLGSQLLPALRISYGGVVRREVGVRVLQLPPVGTRTAVTPLRLDVFEAFSRICLNLFAVQENIALEALT